LIIPCEVSVKSVVPAIKAIVAKELVETHGLKQTQVAKILNISQSAVSKYVMEIRGHVISIEEAEKANPMINKMIELLLAGSYSREEFLSVFCRICVIVRKESFMCPFCQKTEPEIKKEGCDFCL